MNVIKKISILFLWVLCGGFLSNAQEPEFKLDKKDVLPGWVASERVYNDSALMGYMNGGADLFLEYGVKKLTVQQVVFRSTFHIVEIYEMNNITNAYGIYSVSIHQCKTRDSITMKACINPYQVQFAIGKYYVSITNKRGDTATQRASTTLAQRLLKKIHFEVYMPAPVFQNKTLAPYLDEIKVMRGSLGLQNGYPDWSDYFPEMKRFFITMLPLSIREGSVNFSRIVFENAGEMETFIQATGLQASDRDYYWSHFSMVKSKELLRISDFICLYLESEGNHPLASVLKDAFKAILDKADQIQIVPEDHQ